MEIKLTDDAIDYVAEKISNNIREVTGALKNIHLYNRENLQNEIDVQVVKNCVRNFIRPKNVVSYDKVIDCLLYTSPSPRD